MTAASPPTPPAAPGAAASLADADDDLEPAAEQVERRVTEVTPLQHGLRLDKVLVAIAGEFSRTHLQRLTQQGAVEVDGEAARSPSRRVSAGQRVCVALHPTDESLAFKAQAMALAIVHEDDHLLVLDKPAGLVVHPAPGNWSGTLLNGLLAHHCGAARLPRAGIVHRLDKDTSGLMVVAKTAPAMLALTRAIAAREVRRDYLALAHGHVERSQWIIDAPVGRDPRVRVRMAVVASGKPARTDVALLATHGSGAAACSALHCRLHTGRTHQIRVHLGANGHPLVADALYGGKPLFGLTRQALHAGWLALRHPQDGRPLAWHAPPPPDLAQALRTLWPALQVPWLHTPRRAGDE